MAKYLDDGNYFERREDPPVRLTATEARQGRLDRPVLIVLVTSLVLIVLAWAAVELWGTNLASLNEAVDPTATSSMRPDSIADEGKIDNNPPAGDKIEPAPAIKDPSKI